MKILFDAFGTLFDTQNKSIKATERIFSKYELQINPETIYNHWKIIHKSICTNSIKFITEEKIFKIGLQQLFDEYKINGNVDNDINIMLETLYNRPLYDDVETILTKLINQKHEIFIASNSDLKPLEQNIIQSNIQINGFWCSETLQVYKPNTQFYRKILNSWNDETIDIKSIIFIGDSLNEDVLGPKNNEINAIWLNRKKIKNDINCLEAKNMNDVYEIIKEVANN